MRESFLDSWYSDVGKYNWFFSVTATGLSNTEGSFRLSTTKQGFSPKYYGNAWGGNQYATTYNIAKIGRMAGRVSFGIGVVSDGVGVWNYYQNPASDNVVSPGKAGLNIAMGIWGFTGVGTVPAIFYFGAEAFHPQGAAGLINDAERSRSETKLVETFPEYSLDWLINNEGEPDKLRVQNKKLLVKKMKEDAEAYAQQISKLDLENKDLKEQIIQSHKQHLSQSQKITELSQEIDRYKKNSPSAV